MTPRVWRWALIAGVSLAAGVAVSFIASRGRAPPATAVTKVPTAQELPVFELPDIAGRPHSIAEWRGKLLVLNFWATWCAPCRREMPLLDVLNRESAADLAVVGVAIDHAEPVQSFVSESGVRYPILVGQDEAMQLAQRVAPDFEGLPLSLIVAADGKILKLYAGELHPWHIKLIAEIAAALAQSRLTPAEARRRLDQGLRNP